MQTWLITVSILFWISLAAFLFHVHDFLKLFIFSEVSWILLFTLSVLYGVHNDDLTLITLSFFLLGFAGVEFVVAYLLIVLFKKYNLDLTFHQNEVKFNNFIMFNLKKLNTAKINWN